VFVRQIVTAMVLVASVSPASGFAASMSDTTQAALAPTRQPGARLGTHAVTGMVISVSPSRLVIVCSGKNATEMTFVLNSSTRWEGALTAGTVASVRYLTERRALVATGVFVHEHRSMNAHQAAARASPTVNR
jgi:hypothetical protein